ncbi:DUF397 domain-containing protein [Streptomyces barringtoniae]|uniref:DUF397 domain-containing protein n=1 Tax=Streptomyces barringtoniae TaxID=2892029 RepID=UPI001E569F67|nr:DUF397 domain-containing protein [Streptomyces barringtoniae]MCC5477425.1 DUF397 domain-containing protein [Streptomyces barringtoniae]
MAASSQLHWFKSSYSGGSGTECVECAYTDDGALIRDSKRGEGSVIRVRPVTWHAFIGTLGTSNEARWRAG